MPPHLRIARPVSDLARAEAQYVDGLGLQVLGRFAGHDGFDGLMLGLEGAGWHLEFTFCRAHPVPPAPTAEDLLVLYLPERADWEQRCSRLLDAGFVPVEPLNPWWQRQGRSFACADGYRVVLQQGSWPGAAAAGPVVDYDDLEAALHYTSTYVDDQRALVSRTSGEIFYAGIYGAESDLPADVGDAAAYVAVPHRHDLDLGRPLVRRFCIEQLTPALANQVEGLFRRAGAYGRFKDLLHRHDRIDAWHAYEDEATERALRAWCAEVGLVLGPRRRAPPAAKE
jgi:catechol 2,3-dioxygenase-like lactoylglutathione lyase family enzyme